MNVDNQTILHIKAGHVAPMQLISCILAKKPNVWGVAVQDVEDGKPELAIQREDAKDLSIDDVKTLMENAKDRPLTIYFGKLAEPCHMDDIQPFIISDSEDKPFMTIFVEGTLVGHDVEGRTEQATFVDKIIIPQILEWCEDFEGDLDKITKKLNSDTFNNNLLAHVGHRAVIHIMPFDGEVITLGKNELGETEDWGFTSQHHDYKAVKEQEPEKAAEPEKKNKFFAKKSTPTATAPTKKENPPGVHTVGATTATGGKVQDAATPASENKPVTGKVDDKKDALTLRCPSWLHKNGDVKLFYQLTDGYFEGPLFKKGQIPGSWKKRIPVIVKDPKVFAAAEQWKTPEDMHKFELSTRGSTSAPLPKDKPVAEPLPAPQEDTNLPIIPAKELEKILDVVSKLDANSKEIIDPKEYKDFETLHDLFSESVGAKIEETLNWPVSGLFAIGKTDYRAAVMGWIEARAHLRQAIAQGYKPGTFKNVVTKTTDLGNGSTKTESVVTTHVPPAAKASDIGPKQPEKAKFFAKKKAA